MAEKQHTPQSCSVSPKLIRKHTYGKYHQWGDRPQRCATPSTEAYMYEVAYLGVDLCPDGIQKSDNDRFCTHADFAGVWQLLLHVIIELLANG